MFAPACVDEDTLADRIQQSINPGWRSNSPHHEKGTEDTAAYLIDARMYMFRYPHTACYRLQLLVVTVDGRRLYFSTCPPSFGAPQPGRRPSQLQAEVARRALPQPGGAPQGRVGLAPQPAAKCGPSVAECTAHALDAATHTVRSAACR